VDYILEYMIMKKNYTLLLLTFVFVIFTCIQSKAQKEKFKEDFFKLTPLSQKDSIGLINLPKLTMEESFKGKNPPLLPPIVDNSQQIFWRPVFAQVQYECGQASGVGLGFTYAMNRERNLPSDVPENQYPTYFCFNWDNDGNGYHGVSYFHSFEIIKALGTPDVETYGGMTAEPEHWMTGYDNYYEAMHNRISEVYQIDVSTAEGIETAKHWIHNHLENADVGGVANFYTSAPYGMPTLPAGTPEEGKYVVTSWGGANHGLTISMYHDSICWDYNNDGQYTNDIDLNGDGIITPQDWEIGGFRFANTYSGGPNFGNDGFSYMTYKSCADPYGSGGIWNNAFHVLYAKENTEPLLTAKITIKYDCREEIRVRMGISTDTTSLTPEYILGFPVFNFQGGCHYMQGGTTEEDKTIEFGLDITPFLNMLEPGTPVRYFLLVDEHDPNNWYTGEIVNFSIMDYTSGVNEIACEQTNVWINQASLTKLWVNHTVNYGEVVIDMDTLPDATVNEPYSAQLTATGGTTPYLWDFDLNFEETNYTETFPNVTSEQLFPGNNDDGYATKQLDFAFPFYNGEYDEVRVHVDGYIMFEGLFTWPYHVSDFLTFTKNKYISPFQTDLRLYTGDGMYYEGDENSATFRWKASINGQEGTSELNFAVRLFKNGDIKYYYGDVNNYSDIEWISGVSAGDNKFYQFTEVTNDPAITPQYVCDLQASIAPEGFNTSRYGVFSGTPMDVYDNYQIKFLVTDQNNLQNSKTLIFSTDGANYLIIDDYSVTSGDDDVIEYGETVFLNVDIKSLGEFTITGASMVITCDDEFITLIDDNHFLGSFDPGEVKTFTNAFTFNVSNNVPDEHEININTLISDNSEAEWASHIYLTAYAPELTSGNATINDGENGCLDPGETADIVLSLLNTGGATADNIVATLSCDDAYLTINDNTDSLSVLEPYSNGEVTFNITASGDTPVGHELEFTVDLTADLGVTGVGSFTVTVGRIPVLIIDMDVTTTSSPAMEAALNTLGVEYDIVSSFTNADLNQYSSVFVCLGIYNNNYVLSSSEGQELADYLNNSGMVYMEGGDTWAYDSQTAGHEMFNINGTDDGTSDMTIVSGKAGTFTEGMSFSYSGENNWMDHIEPISPAFLILENQDPVYGTAVAYDAGTYKTIGTGHEFGGFDDGASPSTKENLMAEYLDFFGLLPPPVYSINLKAYIEGPFEETEMETELNDQNLLPTTQPFNVEPWHYNGSESVTSIPNGDIVDWVLLEYRDAPDAVSATSASTMIDRKAAFLLKNGFIVGLDGVSDPQFSKAVTHQLYIIVWHRNHLGILSASALVGFNNVYSYNFTSGENQVYGGISAHKEIIDGIWGMVAGDGNSDGHITEFDKTGVWAEQAGEAIYLFGDFNLDGNIDNKDKDDILIPNLNNYNSPVSPN